MNLTGRIGDAWKVLTGRSSVNAPLSPREARLARGLDSEHSEYTAPVDVERHPDVDLVPDNWHQRRRCVLAAYNSPLVKGILDSQVEQICGSIAVECDSGSKRFDDFMRDDWNRALDEGELDTIKQSVRHLLVEGGCVPRVYSKPGAKKLEWEVLPYRRIYTPYGKSNVDPKLCRDGFRYEPGLRKQVSCFIRDEETSYDVVYWDGDYTEVPLLSHPRLPVMAGQTKGLSWFSSCIVRLEMIQRWQEALLNTQELQAYLVALVTTPGPDATKMATSLSGIPAVPNKMNAKTEKACADYARRHKFMFIPNGGDLKLLQANAPHIADFLVWNLRFIARALGTSYERLVYDLTHTSYSSTKYGDRDDKRTVCGQQTIAINHILQPINQGRIANAMLRSDVSLPGTGRYADDPAAFARCVSFQLPGRPPVDELKSENANTAALRNRTASRTRICADKGDDWREIQQEQLKEDTEFLQARIKVYTDCGWDEKDAREYALEDLRAGSVFAKSTLAAKQDVSADGDVSDDETQSDAKPGDKKEAA